MNLVLWHGICIAIMTHAAWQPTMTVTVIYIKFSMQGGPAVYIITQIFVARHTVKCFKIRMCECLVWFSFSCFIRSNVRILKLENLALVDKALFCILHIMVHITKIKTEIQYFYQSSNHYHTNTSPFNTALLTYCITLYMATDTIIHDVSAHASDHQVITKRYVSTISYFILQRYCKGHFTKHFHNLS
jgi:hypothetical protein